MDSTVTNKTENHYIDQQNTEIIKSHEEIGLLIIIRQRS